MSNMLAATPADMLSWALWALAGVAGLVVLFYLGAPLLIYSSTRLSAGNVFEEIEVEQVRPEAHEYFARMGDEFTAIGYEPWLTLRLRGYVKSPNAGEGCGMVFANRAQRTMALVSALFQPTPNGETVLMQAEFSSERSDGLEYNTTNTRGMAQEAPDPKVITVQARGLEDVKRLHAIHAALCRGEQLRTLPSENELIVELNEQLRRKLKRREENGILLREQDGVTYRPTMWGAYVMTWRLLPPHTWLYWGRHAALVRRLEREAQRAGAM